MLTKQFSGEIAQFLDKYLDFYKEFLQIEQNKFDIISKNNIEDLDSFVVREQALMLQSRGFEVQREQLLKKELDEPITLRELIPLVDESFRGKVEDLFSELSDVLLNLKDVNNRSNSLVELRLHKIDKNIRHLENQKSPVNDYNNSAKVGGKQANRLSGIVSKKI